jgi:hypothetical protein
MCIKCQHLGCRSNPLVISSIFDHVVVLMVRERARDRNAYAAEARLGKFLSFEKAIKIVHISMNNLRLVTVVAHLVPKVVIYAQFLTML